MEAVEQSLTFNNLSTGRLACDKQRKPKKVEDGLRRKSFLFKVLDYQHNQATEQPSNGGIMRKPSLYFLVPCLVCGRVFILDFEDVMELANQKSLES